MLDANTCSLSPGMLPLADGHLPPAVSKIGESAGACDWRGCSAIREDVAEMFESEVMSLILCQLWTQTVYKA